MRSSGFFILIVVTAFFFAVFPRTTAHANAPEQNSENNQDQDIFYLCKNQKLVRWLRAHKLENGKCITTYSKEGYLQVISSATYFTSCEGVLHNVRKNIEEGGFKCNRLETYTYLELE